MKNVLLPLHVAGLAMAVHPWHSYEQQPIVLSFTHRSEFIGYMSLVNFLDNQACISVASSNISAAMEAVCQASVTSAQVVLISKLTMQGSAG